MKFMAVCGSGLGSSFMVQMNIEKILKELGVSGIEVQHSDISSASSNDADVFFLARDVAEGVHYRRPQLDHRHGRAAREGHSDLPRAGSDLGKRRQPS